MAFEAPGAALFSFEAAVDLSTKQFHFVKLDGTGKVTTIAAVTDRPLGILQNKPVAGQAATVLFFGISKVVADENITAGALVGTSADGQADGAHAQPVGFALIDAGVGNIGTIAFNCLPPMQSALPA
ncbi:MAG: hypothetical protein E6R03_14935 [Hyphomicrobiaceae bacterium]|nr:MAG: hypothetical protein E6R03_14935 [Hyphomicrobiaceae bacterium]